MNLCDLKWHLEVVWEDEKRFTFYAIAYDAEGNEYGFGRDLESKDRVVIRKA